jgi:hypothetical protein
MGIVKGFEAGRTGSVMLALAIGVGACLGGSTAGDATRAGTDENAAATRSALEGAGGGAGALTCSVPKVPTGTGRPVDMFPKDRLTHLAARMPCIGDTALVSLLESMDTMWYDETVIVPGYQDSCGDNQEFPIGMRPNTIDPNLIVAGGHEAFFQRIGEFNFPFGNPTQSDESELVVVDFWKLPRDAHGTLLPVTWTFREPPGGSIDGFTHRYDWTFPAGTVFGEMMFMAADGEWFPFEIRTRTRTLDGWKVDVHRPFLTAAELAAALTATRAENTAWASSAEITALVNHALDPSTLTAGTLTSDKLSLSFPALKGAWDYLPGLSDPSMLKALLLKQSFRSARGATWKSGGGLTAYAASTNAAFHVVPKGFNGSFFSVDDNTCNTCHQDAGRPFEDYYDFVMLYGELWGGDETFSWHPFETSKFVDANGEVVGFDNDQREMRADFVAGKVVAPFDPAKHTADHYKPIVHSWSNFVY